MLRSLNWLAVFGLLILGAWPVQAAPDFPALSGRVVDEAHVLDSAAKAQLENRLAAFEAQTGHQIVVVTLPTLNNYEIADYTYQLGRHWQIGQKGANDGALILMVPSERVVRIEAGYGLEGDLTDAASSLVINNIMLPFFKQNNYQTGLLQGTDAVLKIVQGDQKMLKKLQQDGQDEWLTNLLLILFIIGWVILTRRSGGRRSSGLAPFILGSLLGSGRRGGGGGFGGGGFSGGGGSFGGGGASGRW